MSAPHSDDDETLRRAFQSLADADAGIDACSDEDTARIWEAVHGELDAESRRALIARLADEPALAEAWRLAQAFSLPEADATPVATPSARREWPAWWLAAAAVVLIGITGVLVSRPASAPGADIMRDGSSPLVESLIPSEAVLPRDGFQLQWRPGPDGARYHVRVTSEDLQVLATFADLADAQVRVPPDAVAGVAAGARVFWQVEVTLPGGGRVTSDTFVVRIQ